MQITILSLFPEMFAGPFDHSIIKRASDKRLITIACLSIRSFATDAYKTVDDHPYGGGHGMILRVDVMDRAIQYAKKSVPNKTSHVILLDTQGIPYTESHAVKLSTYQHLILVCGHYEGVDERIRSLVDEEITIGDYVLTGGELPAMVITDTVVRLLPGVVGNKASTTDESFSAGLLEYPQYTRPAEYKGKKIPKILLSGDHAAVNKWRAEESRKRTKSRRPDLLKA